MVEKLLGEGFDAAQLSGVLLDLLMDYEMKDVPVIAVPKPVQKAPLQPTPEGMVRLRFSVGRNQRVAPNQLVGAITEKVDISGKQIGKIYCYGDYSLVELPSKYKQEVIRSLNGEKINGVRADVRLYDSRTPSSSRPSSPRRGGAPTRRIPVTKRRGY